VFNVSATITPVSVSDASIADASIVVYDEYRELLYTEKPKLDSLAIAFVRQRAPSLKAISIYDNEEVSGGIIFTENSARARLYRVFNSRAFSLQSADSLVTDVVSTDAIGRVYPLYFKHVFKDGFASDPEIGDARNDVRARVLRV